MAHTSVHPYAMVVLHSSDSTLAHKQVIWEKTQDNSDNSLPFARHIVYTHGNDVHGEAYSGNTSGSILNLRPAKPNQHKSQVWADNSSINLWHLHQF